MKKRPSSLLAIYERLVVIPLSIMALAFVLGFIGGPLGGGLGEGLVFLGGMVFLVGFLLAIAWLIGYCAIRILRRVGTTTGLIVEEPDPPPPLEPVARCPVWRVALPDGLHTVYIGDVATPQPERLACDGRWVDVTWPRKWGRAEGVFSLSGHRATLAPWPDWLRMFGWKNWFGMGGAIYRHDLRVDGASVTPLAAGAAFPN